MNLTLPDLTLGFSLIALALLLWQNFKIRELALARAKQYCQKLDLQILDDAVYGISWRPVFYKGQPRIRRRFRFTFTTTGEQRYHGELEMIGRHQTHISVDPHRID
ncbi:DUF3301 domain-containing protein [Marinomonas ostreistagni]|uniref:DUF3301 domain-containing protein n=1 Tax=Marinomonas ostreistagni TaxID=359209 RepID=UPI0019502893|nr:DUF3301 domain-containing protein [Marinomonas ostreistagni]MBM6550497.1 DUF3301 domain-containing protein [Marinomonas ostreistagni]